MPELDGSKTLENLMRAFANESQSNRRSLHCAKQADLAGQTKATRILVQMAEIETRLAYGCLELSQDASAGEAVDLKSRLEQMLKGQEAGSEDYQKFAEVARAEGFEALAEWFDKLSAAKSAEVLQLKSLLDSL